MANNFEHVSQQLVKPKSLVYTAMSKHLFYYRMHISKYVIEQGSVPLNPFMVFDYFLLDTVDRDLVREGDNSLVMRADETWVFGNVSNGVLAEIQLAKQHHKPVKYFAIEKPHHIVPTDPEHVQMEPDVAKFKSLL